MLARPHGTLLGMCNGDRVGGICTMMRCDPGYILAPATAKQQFVELSRQFEDDRFRRTNRTCIGLSTGNLSLL